MVVLCSIATVQQVPVATLVPGKEITLQLSRQLGQLILIVLVEAAAPPINLKIPNWTPLRESS